MSKYGNAIEMAMLYISQKFPFYSYILQNTLRVPIRNDTDIDGLGEDFRLGVTLNKGKAAIIYNIDACNAMEKKELVGAIIHEVEHVIRNHIIDRSRIALGQIQQKAYNIAADMCINEYITAQESLALPPNCVYPSSMNYPNGKTTLEYYNLLMKNKKKSSKGNSSESGVTAKDVDDMDDINNHHWKKCTIETDKNGKTKYKMTDDELSEAEQDTLRQNTKNIIKEAKDRGLISGERFNEIIGEFDEAKIDWRDLLRQYCGSITTSHKKHTYMRQNRRLNMFGVRGAIKTKDRRILGVIDTSGSISDKEYHDFINELRIIKDNNTHITFMHCDYDITWIGDNPEDLKIRTGYGGTSFVPPIEFAAHNLLRERISNNIDMEYAEKLSNYRWDLIVYLTDGYGDTPNNPNIPTIWITVGEKPVDWGTTIYMEE